MKKRVLAVLLMVALVLPMFPTSLFAMEVIASGECGENVTWELDSDGVLTISGSGEMESSPWKQYGSKIKRCILENGVKSIGGYAFYTCYGLTSITIPDSVITIGDGAFEDCAVLTSITIPDSVITIGDGAFKDCWGLTSITIPDSVITIGDDAFWACYKLTNITIPDSVTSIGRSSFRACDGLTSITIPDSVTDIKPFAFYGCGLTDVYYTGTQGQWNKIGIGLYNGDLLDATIHFNSTGPIHTENSGNVRLFTSWDAQNQVAYFGEFDFLGCKVTEKTDSSFLANVENLIGKYVWVESVPAGNGMVDSSTLLSMKEVKAYTGTVTSANSSKIVIDGTEYDTPKNLTLVGLFEGEFVRYYLSLDGELLGLELTDGSGNNDNNDDDNKPDDDTNTDSSFNESIYRADYLLSDAPANLDYYVSYINKFSPAHIIMKSGELQTKNEMWRTVTLAFESADDLSNLANYAFEQSDIYTAILINALEKQTEYSIIDETIETTAKTTKALTDRVIDILEQTHNMDIVADTDYRGYSSEEKKKIKDAFLKALEEKGVGGALFAFGDAANIIDQLMDDVSCIEDFVNCFYMYSSLFEVSDSMSCVLKEMVNDVPKDAEYVYMRNAINFCIDMIEETEDEFYAKVLAASLGNSVGKYAIKNMVKVFYERLKEKAILACPELGVLLASYKLSHTAIDILLNVDDISEQSYKLSVVNEYYSVLQGTIMSLKKNYENAPSEQNANALLNALELLFGLSEIDCETASALVKAVDNATYNKIMNFFAGLGLGNGTDYSDIKNYIRSTQKNFSLEHRNYETLWLNQLEADYPGIYKLYVKDTLDDVLVVPITKSYTIKCPVYVYVYDKANNLVAFIDKDRVYAEGNITVSLIGETKIVSFFDNEEYTVVCKGYDTGTMDITVTEYSEGAETRKTVFYELKVSDGASYQTKTNSSENTVMHDNTTISADFDSKLTSETDKHHIVIENGYISGENGIAFEVDAYANAALEISAYIPDGFVFIGWEITAKDGGIKDRTASTTTLRVPSSDTIVRAIIEPKDKDDIPVSSESFEIFSSSESETSVSPDTEPSNLQNDDTPIIIWIIIPLLAISLSAVLIVIFIKKKKR